MYIALVRSKMDYACFLYSNAAETHLEKLDRIQFEAIRIITGNFKTTMTDNLEAEINLIPLALRRKHLALNYFGKVYRLSSHPVKEQYDKFDRNDIIYQIRPSFTLPVTGRVKKLAEDGNIPIPK